MITSRFPLGDVSFSAEYFSTLWAKQPNIATVWPQWPPVT